MHIKKEQIKKSLFDLNRAVVEFYRWNYLSSKEGDIARNYIEEEINIPAMESTTSELIEGLRNAAKQKKLKLSAETVENLEKVLKQADLVKFAKVKPLDFEIEEDKKRISSSIITIHKSIPEIVEEKDELDLWNEQQKELARIAKLKKEKRKNKNEKSIHNSFSTIAKRQKW